MAGFLAGGFGGVSEDGEVAHFSAGAGFEFAIEVDLHVPETAEGGPIGGAGFPDIAQEVDHGGRSEEFGGA